MRLRNGDLHGGPNVPDPHHGVRAAQVRHTRRLLNAALDGELDKVAYSTDPVFGFEVPKSCPEVPEGVLDPASSWGSREEYRRAYRQLAARFIENFKKFADDVSPEVRTAGPQK